MDLHLKYRPKKLERLVGQPEAVKVLSSMVKKDQYPKALVLSGPSGCGKTTIARIMQHHMGCHDTDFIELDCGMEGGKEVVRWIGDHLTAAPKGKCRIWYVDEAHGLTSSAQDAMLKMLEESPPFVYFMLSTTAPEKLKKTIHTRCAQITVNLVKPAILEEFITKVSVREGVDPPLSEEVVEKIVEAGEGSPRAALVALQSVMHLEDDEERSNAIMSVSMKSTGKEIAQALMNPKTTWPDVVNLVKDLDDDPEKVRRVVLGYCCGVLMKPKPNPRAYQIIQVFRDPWDRWYDSGKALLLVSCYELVVLHAKK